MLSESSNEAYMLRAAVILAGCGHLDGSEIRESVLALLALDECEIEVECFAPNLKINTSNYLNRTSGADAGNALEEAAKIARGAIKDLKELPGSWQNFSMLVIPGGYGVLQNLSDISQEGAGGKITCPEFQKSVELFLSNNKAVGGICIAPALIALILKNKGRKFTLGSDAALIKEMGGIHIESDVSSFVQDENIFSTPAYMVPHAHLKDIAQGIKGMIEAMAEFCRKEGA